MNLASYDTEFLIATLVISVMALVFYTLGVWGERLQRKLLGWHLAAFGFGVICNFVGITFMMELMRLTGQDDQLHTVLGSMTLFLITIHAIWAFWTFRKGSARAKRNFSNFGILLWSVWLIPYFVGIYIAIFIHQ